MNGRRTAKAAMIITAAWMVCPALQAETISIAGNPAAQARRECRAIAHRWGFLRRLLQRLKACFHVPPRDPIGYVVTKRLERIGAAERFRVEADTPPACVEAASAGHRLGLGTFCAEWYDECVKPALEYERHWYSFLPFVSPDPSEHPEHYTGRGLTPASFDSDTAPFRLHDLKMNDANTELVGRKAARLEADRHRWTDSSNVLSFVSERLSSSHVWAMLMKGRGRYTRQVYCTEAWYVEVKGIATGVSTVAIACTVVDPELGSRTRTLICLAYDDQVWMPADDYIETLGREWFTDGTRVDLQVEVLGEAGWFETE